MHFYLDVFRDSWLPRDGSFRDGLNDGGSEEFRGRGHAEARPQHKHFWKLCLERPAERFSIAVKFDL